MASQQELEARIAMLEAREAAFLERLKCIAHDLASPLTPMRLQLARWEDHEVPVPGADLMRRSIERLCQMTQDVADLASVEAGMRMQKDVVDLRQVAADAFDAFQGRTQHDLRLCVPDKPVHVKGDGLRILQALDNLVRNAVKFTPHGGRIDIEVLCEGDAAVLAVRDTGRGLTPADVQGLFRPYAQARAEDAAHGSGLGLHITRTILQGHAGTVHAESAGEGRGSRFVLRMPLDRSSVLAPAARPRWARPAHRVQTRRLGACAIQEVPQVRAR